MTGGGLMALIAFGAQDMYLMGGNYDPYKKKDKNIKEKEPEYDEKKIVVPQRGINEDCIVCKKVMRQHEKLTWCKYYCGCSVHTACFQKSDTKKCLHCNTNL
jgi:hypothetical protein